LARNLQLTSKVTIASSGTTFTFQASDDANNFYDLYNGSTQYSVTVAASRFVALNTEVMAGVRYLKVVSNSAEAASRDIIVINGEL
jgi:predicted GTPase